MASVRVHDATKVVGAAEGPELAWRLHESWGRPQWGAASLVQSLWLRNREAAQQLAGELGQRGTLAKGWAGEDPGEAYRWATNGKIGKDDARPLRDAADQWAIQDVAGCRSYFEKLPGGPARDAMLTPLMRQIGRDDWRLGAQWLLEQPASEVRARTLSQLITAQTSEDPEGVSALLQRLPPSVERDTCIQQFVQQATAIDPAAAMDWLGAISDTRKASNLADHQIENWIKKDATAAKEWLRSSAYATPAMKGKWLKE